jgi:hypothetical protein
MSSCLRSADIRIESRRVAVGVRNKHPYLDERLAKPVSFLQSTLYVDSCLHCRAPHTRPRYHTLRLDRCSMICSTIGSLKTSFSAAHALLHCCAPPSAPQIPFSSVNLHHCPTPSLSAPHPLPHNRGALRATPCPARGRKPEARVCKRPG